MVCRTDVLNVRYEVRIENNRLFQHTSTERLKRWHRVAKQSGLFRDPRCMQLLRAVIQSRD